MLACGLDGVDREMDPGEPNTSNLFTVPPEEIAARGIKTLPPTLLHAADNLAGDDVLRKGLGEIPGGWYSDYYAEVKREEFLAHHHQVTPGEIDQYLTLF